MDITAKMQTQFPCHRASRDPEIINMCCENKTLQRSSHSKLHSSIFSSVMEVFHDMSIAKRRRDVLENQQAKRIWLVASCNCKS